MLFGGNWNNASNAGVFYRNLNNYRSNDNDNVCPRLKYLRNIFINLVSRIRE